MMQRAPRWQGGDSHKLEEAWGLLPKMMRRLDVSFKGQANVAGINEPQSACPMCPYIKLFGMLRVNKII